MRFSRYHPGMFWEAIRIQHRIPCPVQVSLMIADAHAVDVHTVALFGMWGKRKRQFGDPIVWCATEHDWRRWVKASVYIVRFFDPFNWFEALCNFTDPVFAAGTTTYVTLKGSAAVKKVAVQGYEPPAERRGIALCLSQFHNRVPNRVMLEFMVLP